MPHADSLDQRHDDSEKTTEMGHAVEKGERFDYVENNRDGPRDGKRPKT